TFGHSTLDEFYLDPDVLHLNHGSYGAVPKSVMREYQRLQTDAEAKCSTYFREDYYRHIATNLSAAADQYGGTKDDWVFVENATSASNAVFQSEVFRAGDEVLFTSHIYGAVRKAILHRIKPQEVNLREVVIDLPLASSAQVINQISEALTPRTKLLVIDHITSTSALTLPVTEISKLCRKNETRVYVDGAHVPGQMQLDVPSLDVDYYACNAHKWHFAPKGCGLLWVKPDRALSVHPTTISHGLGQGLHAEFSWIGTRDSSAWFAFQSAIAAHDGFGGLRLMKRNRALAAEAGALIAAEFGTSVAGPPDMQTAMTSIRLPKAADASSSERIQRDFSSRYAMETSFVPWNEELAVRISAQVYNELSDYEKLIVAIRDYFELGRATSTKVLI
ncbi:MAG: aminotransferase class V-fold PLP-dependent enzyme, partial [Boseongicola sp.]